MAEPSLKLKTARTIKWNAIDKLSSQVMYGLVGVVLANILTPADFGLVGALLLFQAFATLFVDSGFASALLQQKNPTDRDYSTVFWFNLAVSSLIYLALYFSAPLIADFFQGETRLIPLSRIMFLTFVLNGLAIVQTNRLMKRMDVKQIAISNVAGLAVSGIIGIWLALKGYGPWALVWQYVSMAAVKTVWLWISGRWIPSSGFHIESMKKIWRIGLSVFSSSGLNILCQNIYTLIIGKLFTMTSLGFYTQADKWSKMGTASISQILTSSFVPVLSGAQDDPERFNRYVRKINRFSGFILFPSMLFFAAIGLPLFHTLFGTKWDGAIILFQILAIRGIFITLIQLYSNYLLALGYAKKMFIIEIIKDSMVIIAILATVWFHNVPLLVWGQFLASFLTYFAVLHLVCRATGYSQTRMLSDLLPSFAISILATIAMLLTIHLSMLSSLFTQLHHLRLLSALQLGISLALGAGIFLLLSHLLHLPELPEATNYLFGRFRKQLPQSQS